MTREEAIKALGLMEHVESIVATYEPGEARENTTVRELKEACRMAISVLNAQQGFVKLNGSRWEGCETCKGGRYCRGEYCPGCGKPLTEADWAELEIRIDWR